VNITVSVLDVESIVLSITSLSKVSQSKLCWKIIWQLDLSDQGGPSALLAVFRKIIEPVNLADFPLTLPLHVGEDEASGLQLFRLRFASAYVFFGVA